MLKIGDLLPAFAVPNQHDVIVSSDQLKGHWAVLYFYPKLGCTVFGISKDSSKSHTNFISKYNFPFDLLSDADGKLFEAFGVWVEKSMYGKKYFGIERSTFLINPKGEIAHIWRKVSVKGHVDNVIKVLETNL